jgi:DNA-binding LacI/PurR family transcriptional regulator
MFSIKDVAKLANVSVSTVSRVINNRDSINEKTKERVLEAIKALDYKPNFLAKGLRAKSSNLLGLVIPILDIDPFTEIINLTCKIANKNGFDIMLGYCQNNPDLEEDFIVNLIRRHVDGIIFSRVSDESRVLRILNKTDVPVVVIDRVFEIEEISCVILDNYRAGEIAAQHLTELGHEKIACDNSLQRKIKWLSGNFKEIWN